MLTLISNALPKKITNGFCVVVLPDTQYYTRTEASYVNHYKYFQAMLQWINDKKEELNIQNILHVGDVYWLAGNSGYLEQGNLALDMLDDANIPYQITSGNHDYDEFAIIQDRSNDTAFMSAFPQSRYTTKSWWNGGFNRTGHSQSNYNIINIDGVDWLFLCLEYAATDTILSWANDLLDTHSEKPCIVTTHCFMNSDGTRVGYGDLYNPKGQYGTSTEICNDGEDIWDKCIKLHDNIISVQSGHIVGNGTPEGSYRVDDSDGGQPVLQSLSNWQETDAYYPSGWFRLLHINQDEKFIKTYTVSPTQNVQRKESGNSYMFYY